MATRLRHPMAQCDGKSKYRTLRIAGKAAKAMTEKFNELIEPYRCPHCHGLHIGNAHNTNAIAKAYRRAKRELAEAEE